MLVAEKVKGFEQLKFESNKTMFRLFLKNFYNAWGSETRETIEPLKVEFAKDDGNGPYLKFIYKINGRKEWTHIKNPHTWY